MSDGSLSSREPSPTRPLQSKSRSSGSDTESTSDVSWQGSAGTLHPSSSAQSAPSVSTAPLVRQPLGFGAHALPPPTYHPSLASASFHHNPGTSSHASKNKSSKGKEKEKPKDKSKELSRKGKERDNGTPVHPAHEPVGQPQPGAPLQRTTFRVRAYTNDPSATGTPPIPQEGPYGSAFRLGVQPDGGRSRSQPNRKQTQAAQDADGMQPRTSYYRYDYDKLRDSAPANRAKQQAAAAAAAASASTCTPQTASHHHNPQIHQPSPQPYTYTHTPVPNQDNRPHSSTSGSHQDTNMYPTDHRYPSPQYYAGDTYDFNQDTYFDSAPHPTAHPPYHQHQPTPPPTYAPSPSPAPAPPKEKRHKSRSHRYHEQPQYPQHSQAQYPAPIQTQYPPPAQTQYPAPAQHQYPAPAQHQYPPPTQPQYPPPAPPSAQSQPPISQPAARVVRVLTLLIEDKRQYHGEENMLAEVRVPLRPADPGDIGMWADAQEVSEELQKGPSRIDGRAKVYTLRGKYRQYFLRTSEDGPYVCQTANLKVSPQRTLEIFVEDNPPPAGQPCAPSITRLTPSSPLRDLPTPITDTMSMTSPSPVPTPHPLPSQIGITTSTPAHANKRPSCSSLFSAEDHYRPPSPWGHTFDPSTSTEAFSSRKRPRSTSVQSAQSVHSVQSIRSVHSSRSVQSVPSAALPALSHQQYRRRQSDVSLLGCSRGPPSVTPVSGLHSRTSSQTSQPSKHKHRPASPSSSSDDFPDTIATQPTQPRVPSVQHSRSRSSSSAFPPASSSPTRSRSTSGSSGPSPQKKAKIDKPDASQRHPEARGERSVSPVPDRRGGAFPFSDTRTTPRAVSGFEAYANKPPPLAFSGAAAPTPSNRYDAGPFRLPTPKSEPSRTSAAQNKFALPSASGPARIPTPFPHKGEEPSPPATMATMAPSAMTMAPTLSGQAPSELDNAVGKHVRGIISKEPAWNRFVQNRARVLTMREQLGQYAYVRGVVRRFAGMPTPADLEGAGGVCIVPGQVMRAFGLGREWLEECEEILELAGMYGERGTRKEDGRVVGMLDEVPPITTGMQAKRFVKVLREVHAQWTMSRDG